MVDEQEVDGQKENKSNVIWIWDIVKTFGKIEWAIVIYLIVELVYSFQNNNFLCPVLFEAHSTFDLGFGGLATGLYLILKHLYNSLQERSFYYDFYDDFLKTTILAFIGFAIKFRVTIGEGWFYATIIFICLLLLQWVVIPTLVELRDKNIDNKKIQNSILGVFVVLTFGL